MLDDVGRDAKERAGCSFVRKQPLAVGVDSAGGGGGGGGSRSTACVIVRAGVCERTLKAVEWVLYFHVRAGCRSKEGMLAWFH